MVHYVAILAVVATAAVAVNGQYGSSQNSPAYPPAAPPSIPVFVPYPAPPPPVLAELPSSHEFLRARRRHHRSSSSSSSRSRSSSSDSDEHRDKCKHCKKIKRTSTGSSFKPDIYYFNYKGCKRAVITCDTSKPVELVSDNGEALATGFGIQKIAKCDGKKRWKTQNDKGQQVSFSSLSCATIRV